MRIGVLTTSYPRYPGDPAGHFVAGLNRYLVGRGHSVEVLAASEPGAASAASEPVEPGVTVQRIPSPLFYRGGAPDALAAGLDGARLAVAIEAARFSARLGQLLRAGQAQAQAQVGYDALISHWVVPCGMVAAALGGDCPHIAVAHSSDVHLLRRLRLESAVRYVSSRARLVYTSASLRVPGAPGVVVPMGIDTAAFQGTPDQRAAARRRLAAAGPAVLFLGRLVAVKGVGLLLAALAQTGGLDLWIAGDGPLRAGLEAEALRRGLGPRVRFFGEVAGALRRDLLLACDALALPSLVLADGRTDGAPQVVLEGMAAGCAVVASRVGGVPELIQDAGWLVAPGDAGALAQALVEAVQPGRLRDERVAKALRRAATYDWASVAPRILGMGEGLTAPLGW